jgi:serine/threonine-protein kinase ATR
VACLQSLLGNANLQTIVLSTLHILIKTLRPQDVGPYVGVVTATIVIGWPTFTEASHSPATQIMKYIVGLGQYIGKDHMDEIATMEAIVHGLPTAHPLLSVNTSLMTIRHTKDRTWTVHLQTLLKRIYSHNHLVVLQALRELTAAIQRRMEKFRTLFSGDTFDPLVGDIMSALYKACQRDHEDAEPIQLLAYECMGLIGAADPDRYEIARDTSKHIPIRMLGGLKEARAFAVLLISNTLVDLYGSTSDVSYQGHVIYAIQELARFCNFTSVIAEGRGSRSDEKDQWRRLPKHVLQVVSPLVEAGYIAPRFQPEPPPAIPIYPNQSLYRVWLQTWAGHLITKVSGDDAQQVFGVFSHLVRQGDAGVAHDLLPNLVLNIFLSGDETEIDNIRMEIQAVLQDQVHPDGSSHEKRLLSAQVCISCSVSFEEADLLSRLSSLSLIN